MLCILCLKVARYIKVKKALSKLADGNEQTAETLLKVSTGSHCKAMDKLKTALLLAFWLEILNRFNEVSKAMQKSDVILSTIVDLLLTVVKLF